MSSTHSNDEGCYYMYEVCQGCGDIFWDKDDAGHKNKCTKLEGKTCIPIGIELITPYMCDQCKAEEERGNNEGQQ
jgi:hypothetical protein